MKNEVSQKVAFSMLELISADVMYFIPYFI